MPAGNGDWMTGTRIEILTAETFDTAVSDGAVLVEFSAQWCMPCRMLEPVMHQLAQSFTGRLRVMSVDTDKQPALAERFEVRTVPTMLLMRDGEVVRRFSGLMSFERLARAINDHAPRNDAASGTGQ